MKRVLLATVIGVALLTGASRAQTTPFSVVVNLRSPVLGSLIVTQTAASETDARFAVERLFREGYWQRTDRYDGNLDHWIVWPPSAIRRVTVAPARDADQR